MRFGQREVTAPDGRTWRVGIRWLRRRPRWVGWGFRKQRASRRGDERSAWSEAIVDGGLGELPDAPSAIVFALVMVVVLVLSWFFLFPVLIFLFDALIVLVVAATSIGSQVVLRRPWVVEATTADETSRWAAPNWRATRRLVNVAAHTIELGRPLDTVPGFRQLSHRD